MLLTTLTNRPATRPARRRTLTAAAALAAAASLVLAGCAGGGAEDGADGEATLNFTWWGDASRAERYEEAIAIFESENEGITVQTSYAAFGDYWTARNTEAASRSLPDVFQMDLAYLNEYGSFGHVAPLDDYFGEEIAIDGIAPELVEAGEVDGKTYGLASSSSSQAILYNGALLEQLGVAAPTAPLTWDEYDAFLAEVGAAGAGVDPLVWGSIDYTQYFWPFQIWLQQQGKTLIDDDGQLGFTEADLTEWWSRSAGLHDAGAVIPSDTLAQLEGVDPLGSGRSAVDISWDNFLQRFSEGTAAPDLTLLPLPSDDPAVSGQFLKPGLQLAIGANTEHPEESAQFIDFLVNDPRVGEIFGMSRGVPASETARDMPKISSTSW